MTNYTLTNASDAVRWITGELMVGEGYARNGVSPDHVTWIISQCPHNDLTEEEEILIRQTVACQRMLAATRFWHDERAVAQEADEIDEVEAPWEP